MVNHSCNPNSGVRVDDGKWAYVAFRDIKKGEEILYDYAMGNLIVENMPECCCGSVNCRGNIKGYQNLPLERKKVYVGYFAPYLEEMAKQDLK